VSYHIKKSQITGRLYHLSLFLRERH